MTSAHVNEHVDQALSDLVKETSVSGDEESKPLGMLLLSAVRSSNAQVIRLLLMRGTPVSATTGRGTAGLMVVCSSGRTDVAELLLQYGASVNTSGPEDVTALMTACSSGYTDVAELLLKHGASVNTTSNDGLTALVCVCESDHVDVVQMLMNNGASVNKAANNGGTALIASQNGHIQIVDVLLCYSTSLQARNGLGKHR